MATPPSMRVGVSLFGTRAGHGAVSCENNERWRPQSHRRRLRDPVLMIVESCRLPGL
jgi:hypothetical protein